MQTILAGVGPLQRPRRLAEPGGAVLVDGHWEAGIGVVEDVRTTGHKVIVYFPLIEVRDPIFQSKPSWSGASPPRRHEMNGGAGEAGG